MKPAKDVSVSASRPTHEVIQEVPSLFQMSSSSTVNSWPTIFLVFCFLVCQHIYLTSWIDEPAALKAKGNDLFVNRQFLEAAQEYSKIVDEYGLKIPPDFEKVVLCNRAACDIELGKLY